MIANSWPSGRPSCGGWPAGTTCMWIHSPARARTRFVEEITYLPSFDAVNWKYATPPPATGEAVAPPPKTGVVAPGASTTATPSEHEPPWFANVTYTVQPFGTRTVMPPFVESSSVALQLR